MLLTNLLPHHTIKPSGHSKRTHFAQSGKENIVLKMISRAAVAAAIVPVASLAMIATPAHAEPATPHTATTVSRPLEIPAPGTVVIARGQTAHGGYVVIDVDASAAAAANISTPTATPQAERIPPEGGVWRYGGGVGDWGHHQCWSNYWHQRQHGSTAILRNPDNGQDMLTDRKEADGGQNSEAIVLGGWHETCVAYYHVG